MVLWEIITGEIPYKELNNLQIIERVGFDEKIVPIPKSGNQTIIKIIEMCLKPKKSERPTFRKILQILQENKKEGEARAKVIDEMVKFFE